MNEKRQNWVDRLIRKYGFEHQAVISFAYLCEYAVDTPEINCSLEKIFHNLMEANESEVEE